MIILKTLLLFIVTSLTEIIGCYLPYLWLKEGRSVWLLLPAALSLFLFSWLLTLHNTNAGRIYAAYGGIYISVALFWMWFVEGKRPDHWDAIGICIILIGSGIIYFSPHRI
ncbi:MAG: YnfA family protein [Rhizobacter sp.]|nr:YnfA family protein [Bacteriovorax sp.]